jgi:hypothetical protein
VNATAAGVATVGVGATGVGATVAVGARVAMGTDVLVGAGVGVSAAPPQAAETKSTAPSIKVIIVFIKTLSTDSTVSQFRSTLLSSPTSAVPDDNNYLTDLNKLL